MQRFPLRLTALIAFASLVISPAAPAADWPDGARAAVTLTFDLDAETVWWSTSQPNELTRR